MYHVTVTLTRQRGGPSGWTETAVCEISSDIGPSNIGQAHKFIEDRHSEYNDNRAEHTGGWYVSHATIVDTAHE